MCFKMHSVDGVAVQMVRHWLTGSVVNRKAFWCWLTDSSEGASEPFDTHARVFCQRHWPWRNWLDVTYQTSLVTWRREKGRTTGSEVPLPRKSRLVGWGFVTLSQRNLQQCVFYLRRVCVCVFVCIIRDIRNASTSGITSIPWRWIKKVDSQPSGEEMLWKKSR